MGVTERHETLSPSELARLTGVSTDTLRHYERKGVLQPPPRSSHGYRRYPAEAVGRVQLVQRALRIGFSLDQLARVLAERDRGGAPCQSVRTLVAGRLHELETTIRELTALRGELLALLNDWDERLARTPANAQAGLLESLARRTLEETGGSGARQKAAGAAWPRSGPPPRRV